LPEKNHFFKLSQIIDDLQISLLIFTNDIYYQATSMVQTYYLRKVWTRVSSSCSTSDTRRVTVKRNEYLLARRYIDKSEFWYLLITSLFISAFRGVLEYAKWWYPRKQQKLVFNE